MRKIGLYTTAIVLAVVWGARKSRSRGMAGQATVERDDNGAYTLIWNARRGSVDVYVADRADAPKHAMRLLVENDRGGTASLTVDGTARPYFYVAANGGEGLWVAERLLPLEGGRNFRDLGGYATADGRRVKWGKVFRSGGMAGLTDADCQYLSGLGIQAVCDLRTRHERDAEPNAWVAAAEIAYWTRDYDMSGGDLGSMLAKGATPGAMKQAMTAMYRELPTEQAPAYRAVFEQLAAGKAPLAFNCSAGKDRAGLMAALILSALGVPDQTVFADYAMSGDIIKRTKIVEESSKSKAFDSLNTLPPDVLEPLMASDPVYIQAAFAAIREKHTSVPNYLRDELGITEAQLARIRDHLLE